MLSFPAVTLDQRIASRLRLGFLKGLVVDISDGQTPGPSWLGRQAPVPVPDAADPFEGDRRVTTASMENRAERRSIRACWR
jgi:hypothetical protein